MVRGYSKRFAALGIDFAHKYRVDPFVRTEINVVALQFLFSLFLLGVIAVVAVQLYHDASSAVAQGIARALQPDSSPVAVGNSVIAQLDYTRSRTVVLSGIAIVLVTLCFTYAIARLALAPTRNALESQKRFIGNVAHELRTPLSTIKTSTEVALLDERIQPSMRAVLDDIVHELDRISEVINNLLSLNTLTRPERIQLRNVDLGPLVDKVVAGHANLARERNVEVIVKKDSYGLVWGNSTALEQVITNLVKNAISYTQKNTHGVVTISLHPDYRGTVVLSVADTGIGMSQRDLEHVFEPFYRVDTSRVRNIYKSGSGLGLTIVNEIVRAHHGKIHIHSVRNEGTTVSVYLPVGSAQEDTPQKGDPAKHGEISVDFSHVLTAVEPKAPKKQRDT